MSSIVGRHIDDILRPADIGANAFCGVIFRRGHLLKGGGMDDVIHAAKGAVETFLVTDIADEVTHARILLGGEYLLHFELF